MVYDTVIVGGGLFGSIIGAAMRAEGRDVCIIDAHKEGAGSLPAACLMKPSWFSGLGKEIYEPSLELLDSLYGVQDIQFKVSGLTATVHWCDPASILNKGITDGTVVSIRSGEVGLKDGSVVQGRHIIVAAGVWTKTLANYNYLEGRAGAAFLRPKTATTQPFVRPWAPYRQLVAFNRGDGLWVGDGTSIKPENWSPERERVSKDRCLAAVGSQDDGWQTLYGIRPYVKGVKHAVVEQVMKDVWIATGGAKNGTIGAGWSASWLTNRLS